MKREIRWYRELSSFVEAKNREYVPNEGITRLEDGRLITDAVGGGMFGFPGMLLGAPIFAIVYALIKAFVDFRLEKRGLPRESTRYINAPTSLNLKEEKK